MKEQMYMHFNSVVMIGSPSYDVKLRMSLTGDPSNRVMSITRSTVMMSQCCEVSRRSSKLHSRPDHNVLVCHGTSYLIKIKAYSTDL